MVQLIKENARVTLSKAVEANPFNDPVWLNQYWASPEIGEMLVGMARSAIKTPAHAHLPGLVELLWKADRHSVEKMELLDDNWHGYSSNRYHQEVRVQNNVSHIRKSLPPSVSLYTLGKEGRVILMPTVPDEEFILLQEDKEKLLKKEIPMEIMPFAVWVNQRQLEKGMGDKGTILSSRGSIGVMGFVNYLLENFGKPITTKTIAEQLKFEDPKTVAHYAKAAQEISHYYPGDSRFRIKVKENSKDFRKTEYSLVVATEAESGTDFDVDVEDGRQGKPEKFSTPESYPEVKSLIRDFQTLDRLMPVNPNESNGDARMKKDENPEHSWAGKLTELETAKSKCLEAAEKLSNLGLDFKTLPPVVGVVLEKVQKAMASDVENLLATTPQAEAAIANIINDVNTSVVVSNNMNQDNFQTTEAPEEVWRQLQGQRHQAWKLFLTEEYLKTINNESDPKLAEMAAGWSAMINEIRVKSPELNLPFYSTFETIEMVRSEIAKLGRLRNSSERLDDYFPLLEPEVFLQQNKLKKKDPHFYEIRNALRAIHDAERQLFEVLTSHRKSAPVQELLNIYLNAYNYNLRSSLAQGRKKAYQGYFSTSSRGNMELVEFEAMDLGNGVFIPIFVQNPRYRIMPGQIKMIKEESGDYRLDGNGLPIIYFDSEIVFDREPFKNSPVTILNVIKI